MVGGGYTLPIIKIPSQPSFLKTGFIDGEVKNVCADCLTVKN